MIILKVLRWSNWFSYGSDNFLNLEEMPLVQISGKNGSGKSSIPLIIEEVLYGKNHIGKRKQTLVNRYLKNPILTAELTFSKDNVDYIVKLSRKSTIKIQFFKGNEDLTSHTSTNTYKAIQDVLGIDFKVFVQLIYQSSKINLEFLEATDTNRKKFLISLFKLGKYLEIHDIFKKAESSLNSELSVLQGKLITIESWIKKHNSVDLTKGNIEELPIINKKHIDELATHKSKLLNIKDNNRKINKNNQYKELLSNLDLDPLSYTEELPSDKKEIIENKQKAQHKLTANKTIITSNKNSITKIRKLADKCPSCYQDITEVIKDNLVNERNKTILELESSSISTVKDIDRLNSILKEYLAIEGKVAERQKTSDDFSSLSILIDKNIPTDVIIENDITKVIDELSLKIKYITNDISKIAADNIKVESKNAKISVIIEQLKEYNESVENLREILYDKEEEQKRLSILKKAFSTNGLLNYKLDYLIKDLEEQINYYLQELSSGKFQITFRLQEEKLNIEILDEGVSVTIEELSAGELARINAATLLAIRKLMSAISSTKLNILFLDEILGVLDDDGKEKLIDVLLSEKDLNTFLVSHEYSHPLIPNITV